MIFSNGSVRWLHGIVKTNETVSRELLAGVNTISLLNTQALIKANNSDSIRASQARLFLIPMVERLVTALGQQESEHRLKHLLAALRQNHMLATGYAPGNVLNLIMYLGANLRSLDCSHLTLRHVALSGVEIPSSFFCQTVFKSCTFTDTFTSILGLAAATTGGDIRLWRTDDASPLMIYMGHTNGVRAIAFHDDGSVLASASEDDTLRWWHRDTGDCLRTFRGYTDLIKSVAWSPDGTMQVSGSEDETVRLWKSQTGQLLHTLRGHKHLVRCIAFSPDGRFLLSSSYDGTIRFWDIERRFYRRSIVAQQGGC